MVADGKTQMIGSSVALQRQRLMIRSAFGASCSGLPNLEPWQVEKLEKAYKAGRRKVKLNTLAKEIKLDRKDVLKWMKNFSQRSESIQQSILNARAAAMSAAQERKAFLMSQKHVKVVEEDVTDMWKTANMSTRERVQFLVNKPLSRQEEDTLQRVYRQSKFPSEDMLRSLFDLHQIRRARAVQWFKDKREEEKESRKRKRNTIKTED